MEFYVKVTVMVNGKNISDMTEEEKKKLSEKLNAQILLNSGYRVKADKNDLLQVSDFRSDIK